MKKSNLFLIVTLGIILAGCNSVGVKNNGQSQQPVETSSPTEKSLATTNGFLEVVKALNDEYKGKTGGTQAKKIVAMCSDDNRSFVNAETLAKAYQSKELAPKHLSKTPVLAKKWAVDCFDSAVSYQKQLQEFLTQPGVNTTLFYTKYKSNILDFGEQHATIKPLLFVEKVEKPIDIPVASNGDIDVITQKLKLLEGRAENTNLMIQELQKEIENIKKQSIPAAP